MADSHEIAIRVRYAETDRMGLLHHANYFVYFEMGRTELLRGMGLSYRDIEDAGYFLVIVEVGCKFKRPAHYDDLLTLRTTLKRVTRVKIEHHYEVLRDGLGNPKYAPCPLLRKYVAAGWLGRKSGRGFYTYSK